MPRKNGTPKRAAPAASKKKASPPPTIDLPEGFEPLQFGRVAGWFQMKPGNFVRGILLDSFETKGRFGTRTVYKVQTIADGTGLIGPEGEELESEVGDIIGLDERGFLKRLGDVPQGTEIFVRLVGKEPPSEDFPRGVWKFDLGVAKGTKLNKRGPATKDREPGADDGPLPF